MNKEELNIYLRNNNSPIHMVTWENDGKQVTEPVHFLLFNNSWLHSGVEVRRMDIYDEEELKEYVREMYEDEFFDDAYENEKKNWIDGYLYDIDFPQCMPFLPDEIIDIKPISEANFLANTIEHWYDLTEEKKEMALEYIKKLEKEGGSDSDVYDFCEGNHISPADFDKMQAEYIFAGTSCAGCPNNVMNVGSEMYPCNCCRDNVKFARYESYKGRKVRD